MAMDLVFIPAQDPTIQLLKTVSVTTIRVMGSFSAGVFKMGFSKTIQFTPTGITVFQ
jgi:hypothetical protein